MKDIKFLFIALFSSLFVVHSFAQNQTSLSILSDISGHIKPRSYQHIGISFAARKSELILHFKVPYSMKQLTNDENKVSIELDRSWLSYGIGCSVKKYFSHSMISNFFYITTIEIERNHYKGVQESVKVNNGTSVGFSLFTYFAFGEYYSNPPEYSRRTEINFKEKKFVLDLGLGRTFKLNRSLEVDCFFRSGIAKLSYQFSKGSYHVPVDIVYADKNIQLSQLYNGNPSIPRSKWVMASKLHVNLKYKF